MKFKKAVAIILCSSIFLGGCSSFSSIQKDKVMVEKEENIDIDANISKEKAIGIAVNYLKKCYDIKEDKEELRKLVQDVEFVKKSKEVAIDENEKSNMVWKITWDKEENKDHSYGVIVDAQNGKVLKMDNYSGVTVKGITKRKTIISLDKAKDKAFDFIKSNVVSDANNLRLINFHGKGIGKFTFLYNENVIIGIDVDLTTDKVIRVTQDNVLSYICDDANVNIKKEKAIEIALQGIKSSFDINVDVKNLVEDITLDKEAKLSDGSKMPAFWSIAWKNLDTKKEKVDVYGALIDANTGELRSVIASNSNPNQKNQEISDAEMKQIALDFIEKSKYISDMKELRQPEIEKWKNDGQGRGMVGFRYKDEMIWVYIDFTNKKVDSIGFGLKGE